MRIYISNRRRRRRRNRSAADESRPPQTNDNLDSKRFLTFSFSFDSRSLFLCRYKQFRECHFFFLPFKYVCVFFSLWKIKKKKKLKETWKKTKRGGTRRKEAARENDGAAPFGSLVETFHIYKYAAHHCVCVYIKQL